MDFGQALTALREASWRSTNNLHKFTCADISQFLLTFMVFESVVEVPVCSKTQDILQKCCSSLLNSFVVLYATS